MKYKWLNKDSNKNLIVFFNGWGMDEAVVKHLEAEDYDVLMFYDYNSLDTNFDFNILDNYDKKNLIAWSMGVMTASLFSINYNSKTAINGTLEPIDIEHGINPKIYDLTINGFNKSSCEKFIQNMFNTKIELAISREFEEQKSELSALKKYTANKIFQYNKVFISNNDKIIPTKNQVAFWETEPNLDEGHCPFFSFKKWSELL